MGAPMKKCLYWQNVQTFASATPHPHWKCALIQLCFDYWLNLSIEIIIIIVTTYSHVSQVRSVRSISCRKKSPRFSFLLKNATDGHSEDGHCLLLSCPSSVIRVTAKKAKLKLSAFLFLVLLIHCFSIPLCLLKACKGLFEVAFSGAAAIQMKPLGAGAHFPEEKRSKNFIWSFQLKVDAVGAVEATAPTCWYFSLGSHHQPPPAMKWMAASNSFSVSTFQGKSEFLRHFLIWILF